jgi:peroxiredoxin
MRACLCLLVTGVLVAPDWVRAQDSAGDAVQALLDEYQSRERAYYDAARRTATKPDYRQHPAREYLPRFKELAEKYAGQTAALPALGWILDQASRPSIENPKAETHNHAGQPEIAATLEKVDRTAWYAGREATYDLYDAVIAQNPDRAVCAQAAFQKAAFAAREAEQADDPKAARQQALKMLRDVKKTYKDTKYGSEVDGWIFELQKLQVGMKAPDLVGVDLGGKAVRLSDYAGHVVVIDFWYSNGVCLQDLPRERDLLAMFGEQKFTIVGINTDLDRKRAETSMSEKKVTWPTIYDGFHGPLAKEWNVHGTPTRYVLDPHGTIRYRGSDISKLEATVRELMKKMPAPKGKKGKKP